MSCSIFVLPTQDKKRLYEKSSTFLTTMARSNGLITSNCYCADYCMGHTSISTPTVAWGNDFVRQVHSDGNPNLVNDEVAVSVFYTIV